MNLTELITWQAHGYERFHATRANLAMHVAMVPLFWLGNVVVLAALWQWSLWGVLGGSTAMVLSMAVQGKGHALEPIPSVPFSGWQNMLARIFLEQWLTFPRFVWSGGLLRAWQAAAPGGQR
jgi:uncharacterized membrane protein YGL010W